MKYILHNLGLGDHIICNGIVREYSKLGKVGLFCKERNRESVEFMYRDLDVEIIDSKAKGNFGPDYLDLTCIKKAPDGFRGAFNDVFYSMAGLDKSKRREAFYVERDNDLEDKIFDSYSVKPHEYIFVHDDVGIRISVDGVRPQIGLTNNIFGYCKLIEMAKEVHCISSSFLWLTDSMFPYRTSLYHHTVRELSLGWNSEFMTASISNGWIDI